MSALNDEKISMPLACHFLHYRIDGVTFRCYAWTFSHMSGHRVRQTARLSRRDGCQDFALGYHPRDNAIRFHNRERTDSKAREFGRGLL